MTDAQIIANLQKTLKAREKDIVTLTNKYEQLLSTCYQLQSMIQDLEAEKGGEVQEQQNLHLPYEDNEPIASIINKMPFK
jgi:septal ring factor EnvC (AmiA/AmiB activator)